MVYVKQVHLVLLGRIPPLVLVFVKKAFSDSLQQSVQIQHVMALALSKATIALLEVQMRRNILAPQVHLVLLRH